MSALLWPDRPDLAAFPGTAAGLYWSSSSCASSASSAWCVSFAVGYVGDVGKTNAYYVRCVRAGP
ncbi:MAG: DUF1566 domain-containing protein [Myxococcota bacterium]|nr:DUF1566 domain-containing protein [Myxococcota bacterium]